jgi:5'-3' exonuclease
MKTAIIDGDMICYRCAASCEEEPLDLALERADSFIERIMYETGSSSQECYLTGSNNFRYDINPAYKADRKDKPKPRWLQDVREHLVTGWGARVSDGNEADDEMGISQCASESSVICTNDKDLLMIPGEHFNPVTGVHQIVSPHMGMQNFYFQMIMGDTSDNIFGFDGKKRSKVPKFLEPTISMLMEMQTEQDMYNYVYDLYEQHTPDYVDYDARTYLKINGQCLWIWRKSNDVWEEPKSPI